MNQSFRYADLHCHPNLKTFGHSFSGRRDPRSDLWHTVLPTRYRRAVQRLTGITKFSQVDMSTMTRAGARIALVSLYPFEKGFFFHPRVPPKLAAFLADWGIEVGYRRIRHLQRHTDYFADLLQEYHFLLKGRRQAVVEGHTARWDFARNWAEVEAQGAAGTLSVIPTIEGAHVFNTGLGAYGRPTVEEEVLANIEAVKRWAYPPLFIGLAHNFGNDLCGHARSLQRLGGLMNQEAGLDARISPLGYRVLHALLDGANGPRIYIDLKHMSLRARLDYYHLLQTEYAGQRIPLITSHSSVTGYALTGDKRPTACPDIFNSTDLNFFDEEIVLIARSGGLLALQMDLAVHADFAKLVRGLSPLPGETPLQRSARILWNQMAYIAEVCDAEGLFGWGCTAIGSDFDGSIHPFPGVLTAAGLEPLSRELVRLADAFLARRTLTVPENRHITAEEIVERFVYSNTVAFLKEFYSGAPVAKAVTSLGNGHKQEHIYHAR